jgi:FtsP/CotA-like multicopper oxidase with cupredoxin domain
VRLVVLSVLTAALVLAGPACRRGPVDPVTALTDEFRGAYPTEVRAQGSGREYELVAAPAVLPMFDGRPLHVWAYNGQVPGPILHATVGERIRVRFTNRLPIDTTVHWHGVRLPNAMDGAPGLTQPPIRPGESFVYEFVPKDAGTFWFHPHLRSSEQIERGLFGVLVVAEQTPPGFSRDAVWVLDDWRLGSTGEIDPRFNTPHDLMHDGRWGNVVTVNGHLSETLEVRPGERLRLRLVNTANGRVFAPDFAGVRAEVIAVDGMYAAHPLPATGFELAPGNRLDLDVTIPTDAAGRTITIVDRFTRTPFPLASIRVTGAPVATPTFASPARAHVPAWRHALNVAPTHSFELQAQRGGPYGITWTLNGEAYADPADHAHHQRVPFPLGRFLRVRFVNASYRLHPMHVHGMFFKVLARNGTPVDEPYWRDTTLVHGQETVDVGLVPLDPGLWMLHCHILEHAESGMMTTVEVGPGGYPAWSPSGPGGRINDPADQ